MRRQADEAGLHREMPAFIEKSHARQRRSLVGPRLRCRHGRGARRTFGAELGVREDEVDVGKPLNVTRWELGHGG